MSQYNANKYGTLKNTQHVESGIWTRLLVTPKTMFVFSGVFQ